jgi:hypothetical protein
LQVKSRQQDREEAKNQSIDQEKMPRGDNDNKNAGNSDAEDDQERIRTPFLFQQQ